jgi:outer membrane protein
VALGGWQQNPSGEISYEALNINDQLDVEDDLDYDDEIRIHGRAKIDMPLFFPNIYLMGSPTEFEGTGEKNVTFNFGGTTFDANVPFYSKLKFDQYDVALYYGLPFLKTATLDMLNVDIGINVRIVDLDAEVRQDATGLYEQYDATIPLPQVYLGVQLEPCDWFAAEVEGRGITISDNAVYSLIGRLRFKIFGPAFVAAGYRYDKIDVDEDDVVADFTMAGPFAEVGLRF